VVAGVCHDLWPCHLSAGHRILIRKWRYVLPINTFIMLHFYHSYIQSVSVYYIFHMYINTYKSTRPQAITNKHTNEQTDIAKYVIAAPLPPPAFHSPSILPVVNPSARIQNTLF
jgi:hypothetical protein